jgi:hypothetical protein
VRHAALAEADDLRMDLGLRVEQRKGPGLFADDRRLPSISSHGAEAQNID